jgi:hypothetical protein
MTEAERKAILGTDDAISLLARRLENLITARDKLVARVEPRPVVAATARDALRPEHPPPRYALRRQYSLRSPSVTPGPGAP